MNGRPGITLRSPLHLIEEDLDNEPWFAELIESIEKRLAAEVAMDEAMEEMAS